jgi:hypothetical protein
VERSEPSSASVYAPPRTVTDLADCSFYHTMEVPGYGLVEGQWDLRGNPHAYVGGLDFRGKRVLEVGTASGFCCFTMERLGADVVAYDLSDDYDWDVVPFGGSDSGAYAERRRAHLRQLNNAWWLGHRAFESNAKVVYGTAYEIPEEIGEVDVATYCAILRHLRDPFLALERGLRLTRETVVVTAMLSRRFALPQFAAGRLAKPAVLFLPDAKTGEPKESWWHLTPDVVAKMVGVLGFERTETHYHWQRYRNRRALLYTVVGHRTREPGA